MECRTALSARLAQACIASMQARCTWLYARYPACDDSQNSFTQQAITLSLWQLSCNQVVILDITPSPVPRVCALMATVARQHAR